MEIEYKKLINGKSVKLTGELKEIYNKIHDLSKLPKLQSLDHKTRLATYNPSTIDVRGLHCKLVSILAGSLIGLMNSASNIDKGPINMFIKYVMEIILRTEKLSSYPQKYRKSIVQNGGSDHTENNQEEIGRAHV